MFFYVGGPNNFYEVSENVGQSESTVLSSNTSVLV